MSDLFSPSELVALALLVVVCLGMVANALLSMLDYRRKYRKPKKREGNLPRWKHLDSATERAWLASTKNP